MALLTYNSYFDKLPKIKYDPTRSLLDPNYETVTNIFFRVRVIREVLNNINSYYVVEVEDGETPEIVAEKVYGDAGAGWMVLIANQIIDPQFEWPLNYDAFNTYLIDKYGSVEAAETLVHHYNMVVTRELQPDNVVTETRFEVNGTKLTDNNLDVPYNYYNPHFGDPGSLAAVQSVETFDFEGKTITVTTSGEIVYAYDYEHQLNEDRRLIKVIKKEYHSKIMDEFNILTGAYPSFRRFAK
jgi:hypothetical protein